MTSPRALKKYLLTILGNSPDLKLITVMALLLVQFNVAIAQSNQIPPMSNTEPDMQNQTPNKWGPPYPFTPEEILDKLMQVLKMPAVELSKGKVEAIFDMKLVNYWDISPESFKFDSGHSEKNTKWNKDYSEANVDWYFEMSIAVVPNKTVFGFTWWGQKSPRPFILPMCIDVHKLTEAIEHTNKGWILVHAQPAPPHHGYVDNSLYFTRSENPLDSLKVEVSTEFNCMAAIEYRINTQNGN